MSFYKRLIFSFLIVIISCGGTESGGGSDSPSTSRSIADNLSPSLGDLVGGWEYHFDLGLEIIDEYFFYISPNGEFLAFDFLGDSFNNDESCYESDGSLSIVISDLGGGVFELIDNGVPQIQITIEISNNQIQITEITIYALGVGFEYADDIVASTLTDTSITVCN